MNVAALAEVAARFTFTPDGGRMVPEIQATFTFLEKVPQFVGGSMVLVNQGRAVGCLLTVAGARQLAKQANEWADAAERGAEEINARLRAGAAASDDQDEPDEE